jgi:branched-chain amino acid transport system ATP-binding protein
VISVRDLTVELGGVRALDRLSADLTAPVHGVIGPNGAGKTTLLNALSGFVRASAGTMAIDGVPIEHLPARRRAEAGLARTFQTERLAPQLSARDNVAVAADGLVRRGDRADAVAQALAFTGLDCPDQPAASMDGFQRKLLEIARALAGRPRVLLLDEPAGGLSSAETETLERLLGAIWGAYGAQVILVDHDVDLIARTCERVIVLDFGTLLAEGETRKVLDDDRVRAAWLGTADVST